MWSCLVLYGLVRSWLVLSFLSGLVWPCLVFPSLVFSCLALSWMAVVSCLALALFFLPCSWQVFDGLVWSCLCQDGTRLGAKGPSAHPRAGLTTRKPEARRGKVWLKAHLWDVLKRQTLTFKIHIRLLLNYIYICSASSPSNANAKPNPYIWAFSFTWDGPQEKAATPTREPSTYRDGTHRCSTTHKDTHCFFAPA